MKKILSLVCILVMFAFAVTPVNAVSVISLKTDKITTYTVERSSKSNLAAHPKRRQSKTKLYEQIKNNMVPDNIIVRRSIRRGPGSNV